MTQNESDTLAGWLTFKIDDMEGIGVEIPKLTRLLDDLSSSFYTIARAKKGSARRRPGRRAVGEELLAGFRLLRVSPGSAVIELAPPPSLDQIQMFEDEPTADDVALDFYQEVEMIQRGEPPATGRRDIRRTVRAVIEHAGEIGSRVEIQFSPRLRKAGVANGILRQEFSTRGLPEDGPTSRTVRERQISGHAYMVDVEPGRQRVRIKLPDGRDITMEVEDTAVEKIRAALDQAVELQIDEESEDQIPIRRIVKSLSVLPSSGPGSDRPPKSIKDLEQEQGLSDERPDYVALASEVWASDSELGEFLEYLREIRQAAP